MIPLIVLIAVLLMMLVELRVSQANERVFRSRGAVEIEDGVYGVMRLAYPGFFVLMTLEGLVREATAGPPLWWGAVIFLAFKALKIWAIASLGSRWTYRVMVLPGAPLVAHGPYTLLRHPNYVGVVGEMIGMAVMMTAIVTGPIATIVFGVLMWRRIGVEERALGIR